MVSDKDAAERLYTRVFRSLTQQHADVLTFRRLAELGKPTAAKTLSLENYAFALSIQADPYYDAIFLDRKAAVDFFGGPKTMGQVTTETQLTQFQAAVDAASFVFVHSALDATVSDLCRVSLHLKPEAWMPYIERQKVTIHEASTRDTSDLLASVLQVHMVALERESLSKRAERLFAICKPGPAFDPIRNFQYDAERLTALDRLRHDLVHGKTARAPIPNIEDVIEFLVNTGMYLFAMLNKTFDVKINPLYAFGVESRANPGSANC